MSAEDSSASNADQVSAEVEFEFGKPPQKRTLIFDLWAYHLVDEILGTSPLNSSFFAELKPKQLAVLIWAGCYRDREAGTFPLTWEDIARQITPKDFERLGKTVNQAFNKSTPRATEEEKKSTDEQ